MTTSVLPRPLRSCLALLSVGALVATAGVLTTPDAGPPTAALGPDECAPGYRLVDRADLMAEARLGALGPERAKAHDRMLDPVCLSTKHPERFSEIAGRDAQRVAAVTAPLGVVPPGAARAAVRQHEALLAQSGGIPGANGEWRPVGQGPLIVDSPDFPEVNGLGLSKNSGRIDSLDYDEQEGRLFAATGTGGVWLSDDLGESWTSIGDDLPTQVIGAVAWSEAGGGTLVAASGEPLMGGNTNTGLGAFWSDDLGATWQQSDGVPDGAMGFQVAVHPLDEAQIFVATSQGLFRSTDAGRTFEDVMLPVGEVADGVDCAGSGSDGDPYDECQFANFVTDVVIQEPGGTTDVEGGRVVAAVGYRAGSNATFVDGTVHAPGNGIYASDADEEGAPGMFDRMPMTGFAEPRRRGRTEFGAVVGPDQDHNYLYAINEDAFLFECGVTAIDAPEPVPDIPEDPVCSGVANTTFGGIYVSPDFGDTWIEMADTTEVAENPTTHSGLT